MFNMTLFHPSKDAETLASEKRTDPTVASAAAHATDTTNVVDMSS